MDTLISQNMLADQPRVYTDLSGLQQISRAGRENTNEGLRQVAEQFEAVFLNIMMKEMRGAGDSLFEDNYLRSNEMDIHQENFDNQMSMELSDAGGIGLADTLYRQLSARYGNAVRPEDIAEQAAGTASMAASTNSTAQTAQTAQAAAAYRDMSRHESD